MKSKIPFLKWIIAVILVTFLLLATSLWGCNGKGGELDVPVDLKGASNVGSIGFELTYDVTVLEPLEVKTAELTGNAMMEYNVDIPGLVVIGIISSSGINGDGTLVTASFKVIDNEGTCPLTIETIEAHDATTLFDIPLTISAGNFVAESQSLTAPVINISQYR